MVMTKQTHDLNVNMWGDSLPYLEYIPELKGFILENKSLMTSFVCQPLNGVNEEIQNALEEFFKTEMPTDSFLQISMFASPDIEWMLKRYESNRGGRAKDPKLSKMLDDVAIANLEYLREKSKTPINEESEMLLRDHEIWVTFTMPTRGVLPNEREIETFTNKSSALQQVLTSIHMAPDQMDAEMFLHRMKIIHNWNKNASWRERPGEFDASRFLRDQMLDKGNAIRVYEDGIELGNTDQKGLQKDGKYVKLLSVNQYPQVMTFGQLYDLMVDWRKGQAGIRCPFMITLNIAYPDQKKTKEDFIKNRTYVSHMSKTPFAQWVDRISWQKTDYDIFFDQIEKESGQFVEAYLQVMLFCNDKKDGERISQKVQSHGARTRWALTEDRFFCLPLFKASLPGGQTVSAKKHLRRYSKFPSSILKHMCPIISAWKGNGFQKPVYPLVTREGQLFYFDPFTSDGNFNCIVGAASGSGKSFFINGLLTNVISSGNSGGGKIEYREGEDKPLHMHQPHDGGRVFVIDVGRSYEKISDLSGGKFIEFGENFKYSLNPFKSIHEFSGKDGQGDMVVALISYMAAPESELDQFQSAELYNVITAVWESYRNDGTIDLVRDACLDHQDIRMKDIGVQLKRWCKGGSYGEFFSDENPPLSFDGHFVVFELEELKSKKLLQRAVLLQCISCIQHEMFLTGKDRRKLFILDEAWEFLSDSDGGSNHIRAFLEAGWRRFRKYNSGGIAISQSVNDFYNSAVGEAIISNSQWKILLRQEPEDIARAEASNKFTGTPTDFELLRSLHTKKGEYSEIFIRGSNGREVVRLYVPRFMQLMFTTDPDELKIIDKYRDNGYGISEAINEIMKQEDITRREKQATSTVKKDMTAAEILDSII
ncbi:TraC family protein [Photobacterium sp. ZSDE20]|uniref:TraC family protein n=1 Tax=Photobacterium pectinilyticum TaxID=2906793 RepID=A0ABT1N3G5_9GAMM|nr:TraC family protein [Photobacterium sp. ZSDE20]MCQ1058394.1 TraC family protein [Photobacterium sp. ZSDE20]MDD1825243.1 TraC family protein [Photobacterium sp. ZSDE20]